MKLAMVRVDERLIHGQVTMGWARQTGSNLILVANDQAANDPMQSNLMKFAAPVDSTVEVLTLDQTLDSLNSEAWPDSTILMLVRDPIDLLSLVENGLSIERVNVGAVRRKDAKIKLTKVVTVTAEELEAWKKINQHGIRIEVQWIPGDGITVLNDVLRKHQ